MGESRRHAVVLAPYRAGLVAAGVLLGLAALGTALVTVRVARLVVVPPAARVDDVRVLDVDLAANTITLARGEETALPGRFGFWFSGDTGHAKIGEIVAQSADSVTRRIIAVDFGVLDVANRGRLSGWYYLQPGELGLEFSTVSIATELGDAPAWVVPATDSTRWAVLVHGRATTRHETIRAIPVFHDAGYTVLAMSYRNDGEAPRSADGRYALGDTEWRDVDAAIAFAIERGATEVVLMGWSMGGATVLQAAVRAEHRERIRGLVLESPVVDWSTALRYQAAQLGLARPIRSAAFRMIGSEWGRRLTGQARVIDLATLDFVRRAAELSVPVLILHSDDDGYIPATASHALAVARPDIVTLHAFTTAGHTKLWNHDAGRWNAAIASWLSTLTAIAALPAIGGSLASGRRARRKSPPATG